MRTQMIYEDKSILVVYKPAGLAVQTARIGQQDVVSELKNYLRQSGAASGLKEPYLGIVHRLDQPVEGLLVFAKDKKAAASLSAQLQKQDDGGTFHKHYYAVLYGAPAQKEGELVDFLFKTWDNRAVVAEDASGQQETAPAENSPRQQETVIAENSSRQQETVIAENSSGQQETVIAENSPRQQGTALAKNSSGRQAAEAKKAVLYYQILQVLEGQVRLSLADIEIRTGRFHQIRVQMAHLGVPLLGDMKYGSEEAKAAAHAMGIQHVALCAYALEFMHPVTKKKMVFETKPRAAVFSFFSQS